MGVFEITIQHRTGDTWPVVVRHQPGGDALTRWSRGTLDLDLAALDLLLPTDREYGTLLGRALFRDEVRDAFVAATAALPPEAFLRVQLIVEAEDLRDRHWQQLNAPLDRRWTPLLLNQRTPFSLYLPAEIDRRYPPIGRRDLRALILVAGPEDLDGDYRLAPFDLPGTVGSIQQALGELPSQVLASVEAASGPPTLDALLDHLTAGSPSGPYTLLHIVCHGALAGSLPVASLPAGDAPAPEPADSPAGEPPAVEPPGLGSTDSILYLPQGDKEGERRPVPVSRLIQRLHSLGHLPYLTLLSACESANPGAETGLGGAAQRLVRELGTPAVLAMTGRISIDTAGALSTAFYERLNARGEVDLALAEALAGLQGRPDVTIPALFSRLGERPLWSDDLTRPLTGVEIEYGLGALGALLSERAPVLLPEFEAQAGKLRPTLGAAAGLSETARQERQVALAAINQLCGQALDLSFNALALGGAPPAYDTRPPFRGLLPFRAEDRAFFFGRQPLVKNLSQRLARHPFLAILGPSGSGKSSLVLAGLVPALQARQPRLQMAYLTPGSDPVSRLNAALAAAPAAATSDPGGDPGPPPLVIVVDQFEELFTQCGDPAQRRVFAGRLLALLPTHQLVLTMRADFLGDCATLGDFKDEMQAHLELVAPLDAAGLRRAMERQADVAGLRFEAGLGQQILEDVQNEPGAMPLLQHALLLLWKRRHGRWLRWLEYQAFDGIRGAIAHTAEEVYEALGNREQDRVREILLRLTRLGDTAGGDELRLTRRRVPLSELVPAGDDPAGTQGLVQRLADERLLVTSVNETSGQAEVEVAHEALIQYWPRLRAWLDEDPELARLRQELGMAARAWRDHTRDQSYLLHSGTRLDYLEALRLQGKLRPTHLEQRYLSACIALRERRRRQEVEQAQALAEQERLRAEAEQERAEAAEQLAKEQQRLVEQERDHARQQARDNLRLRRRAIVLAVILGIALILAAAAVYFGLRANRQAEISHARELAGLSAGKRDGELDLALLLGVEGFRSQDLPQTRQALFDAWRSISWLTQFPHGRSEWTTSIAWSTEGRLASGSSNGTVILWDLDRRQPDQILEGHSDWVNSVAWSTDGRLASGANDGTIILWALESGVPDSILEGHSGGVTSVAWSADGRLASGSGDSDVIIWDLGDGRPAQILEEHSKSVTSLAWSADGRLTSGSMDCKIILWDLQSGGPEKTLEGHRDGITSLAWSADGRLASGSDDDWVILWDLQLGQQDRILEKHSGPVTSVAWSADGRLASGSEDGTVILWDYERRVPVSILEMHSGWVNSVAWSVGGQLASSSNDGIVILWDLERGGLNSILEGHSELVTSVAWSAGGQLASGSQDSIILWDLQHGQPAQVLEGHSGLVSSITWSTDGQLASSSYDGTIILWDLQRGVPSQTLEGHTAGVTSIAWSAGGQLASGSTDGTIILWNLQRGQPAQILEGSSDRVLSLAWSADGRLAFDLVDGTVILWDLQRGEPEERLMGHSGSATSLAGSADGKLASCSWDGTVILWDLAQSGLGRGEPAQVLEGHLAWCNSVAWSADGRLASGSSNSTIILWDLQHGEPAHILKAPSEWVSSVAWSADGRLASGSSDGTIRVWQMNPQVWMAEACQRAGRNLTQDEWAQYFPSEDYRLTCDQWPPGQ